MNFGRFPLAGDFVELEYGRPDGPSLRSAVRTAGPEYEHDLLRYLRSGFALIATPSIVPDVLSTHGGFIKGLHLLTDGQWLWYSDLAHYVERYHVALDPGFLAHVRSSNWTVPELSDSVLDTMLSRLLEEETG